MKRLAFLQKLESEHRQFGFRNLIYIDESGFVPHSHREHGWARRGMKIFGDFTGKREQRTNLIMAQRHAASGQKRQWLAPMLFKGSCNARIVETWIEHFLMKELHEPTIVVMDNASFHNQERIQKILAKGYHYLIPLPPYSPDLNPIEQTFGAMKKRRQGMSEGTTIDDLILSYC